MRKAEESRQIAKARRKLKKRLEVMDRQFTQSALDEVVERMYGVLKQIGPTPNNKQGHKVQKELFNGNANSAQSSHRVNKLRSQLAKQIQEETENAKSLTGRVSCLKDNDLPPLAHP